MQAIWFASTFSFLPTPQMLLFQQLGLSRSCIHHAFLMHKHRDLLSWGNLTTSSIFLPRRHGSVNSATCLKPAGRCPPCSRVRLCPKLSATCSACMDWRWPGRWTLLRSCKLFICRAESSDHKESSGILYRLFFSIHLHIINSTCVCVWEGWTVPGTNPKYQHWLFLQRFSK